MALKVYLTAATGMLNFQLDANPVKSIPSQHIKYDTTGDGYYHFYNLTIPKGSGHFYAAIWSDLQTSAGAALGVDEAATRTALDALVGVQKTV